ncbi:MAG TPA: hypothetical protein ENG42_01560 [Candidatus Aenigmarchaeota archaeon]|nr:MAG: hypothetical protein DRP03_01270 [Candidatus Aenigmarchaeota archaeon]HDD46137.1 hypothetical protein [Candidatus Aenigmarchaeota archaeon]
MTKVEKALALLEDILHDRGVPRNIRSLIENCIEILKNENEPEDVRINTIVSMLDEASSDPNISAYARTKIWSYVSKLEELRS